MQDQRPGFKFGGALCDSPTCYRGGPHFPGEYGCAVSEVWRSPRLGASEAACRKGGDGNHKRGCGCPGDPALEAEGPVPPPSWLAAWTGGSWVSRTTEEANAGHRRWFADLSPPLRELFLRHPPGEVVELRWDCLPRSVEGFALAPYVTRHGIVIGYLDPTPEMRELGVPPEGALVLLESPDPAAACQGVVFERELARAVGHLQGYDPAAARANLVGGDSGMTETAVSVDGPPAPPAEVLLLPCGCLPERPIRAWIGTPPPGWKPGDPAPHICPPREVLAAPQPPGHETPLPPRIPGA